MKIYDGDSNTSPMLGNPYCGDSLPPSQTSLSNHLFFYFHTNHEDTGTGFKLEYKATSKNICILSRLLNIHSVSIQKIKGHVPFCQRCI